MTTSSIVCIQGDTEYDVIIDGDHALMSADEWRRVLAELTALRLAARPRVTFPMNPAPYNPPYVIERPYPTDPWDRWMCSTDTLAAVTTVVTPETN